MGSGTSRDLDDSVTFRLCVQEEGIPVRSSSEAESKILLWRTSPKEGRRLLVNLCSYGILDDCTSEKTVRLLLILSIQLQLATKQVDYVAAFVHADIDLPPNYD